MRIVDAALKFIGLAKPESIPAADPQEPPEAVTPAPPAQSPEPAVAVAAESVPESDSESELPPLSGDEIREIARLTGRTDPPLLEHFRRDADFRKSFAELSAWRAKLPKQFRNGPRQFNTFEVAQLEALLGPLSREMMAWIASAWPEDTLQAIINPPRVDSREPATPEMRKIEELGGPSGLPKPKPAPTVVEQLVQLNDSEKMQFLMDNGDGTGKVYDPSTGQMVVDLRRIRH
jgi:hypothetical protein